MRNQLLLAAALLTAPHLNAEEANYCKDAATNDHWQQILRRHPADPLVIKLFALRAGLCVMIDQGLITVDQGTAIFEQEREQGTIERKMEELRQTPRSGT